MRRSALRWWFVLSASLPSLSCEPPTDSDERAEQSRSAVTAECASITLTSTRSYHPPGRLDDQVALPTPIAVAIPTEVEVLTGNASNKVARIIFTHADGTTNACRYIGNGGKKGSGDGLTYVFNSCGDGSVAGDVINAKAFKLVVMSGDRKQGTTTAQVTLTEIEPCGGGSGGAGGSGVGGSGAGGAGTGGSVTTASGTSSVGTGGFSSTTSSSGTGAGASGGSGGIAGNGGGGGSANLCTPELVDDGDPCSFEIACDPQTGVVTRTWCNALDPTVPTTMASALSFLYEGDNPMQVDVAPGAINDVRAAGIMGRVFLPDGSPAGGAAVRILGHEELGVAHADLLGNFMLAANGGEPLTVQVSLPGYLGAQRTADVEWQTYAHMSDIVLVQRDPNAAFVDFEALTDVAVAQGSAVSDDRGARQGTLLVSPGTAATMTLSNGTTEALDAATIRITEYTAGPFGHERMPAVLPETSAFTYAIELGVDEADDAGATGVVFNTPVSYFVPNFLDLPVGSGVPVGHLDRGRGVWVPDNNGVIVEVVSLSGGVAQVDYTGDGLADSDAELSAIGLTVNERQKLANLYLPGTQLWYAELSHFSVTDLNYGKYIPDPKCPPCGCVSDPACEPEVQTDCAAEQSGSIIECDNQVLGESVPIAGTNMSLSYRSNRMPGGAARRVTFPMTGPNLPASVLAVHARLLVAGQVIEQEQICPCAPNQTATLVWDGLDALGRPVSGTQPAQVEIGYVYEAFYETPDFSFLDRTFGAFTGELAVIQDNRLADWTLELVTKKRITLDNWTNANQGLGGYSIDAVHAYDPLSGTLWRGDGTRRHQDYQNVIDVVMAPPPFGFTDMAPTADGSVIYYNNGQLWKRFSDGSHVLVAGKSSSSAPPCTPGENVPAINACVTTNTLRMLTPSPDGSIYAFSQFAGRIVNIGADGIVRYVAGNGPVGTATGDGGPALLARISPTSLALAQDGSLYMGESQRIRRISTDGYIDTVAGGNGGGSTLHDNGPALQAIIPSAVNAIAFAPDQTLYFVHDHPDGRSRIRRITTSGIVEGVAGYSTNQTEGIQAFGSRVTVSNQLAVGKDGVVYFSTNQISTDDQTVLKVIRAITPDGIVRTVAGAGTCPTCPIAGSAFAVKLGQVTSMHMGPDGYLLFNNGSMLRVAANLPRFNGNDFAIADDGGRVVHYFDTLGKHLATVDTKTGVTLTTIEYDGMGLPVTITDRDGLVTTIERDGLGNPTAIVAPYGQRTELALDANGYLSSIADPAGFSWQADYRPDDADEFMDNKNWPHHDLRLGRRQAHSPHQSGKWQYRAGPNKHRWHPIGHADDAARQNQTICH